MIGYFSNHSTLFTEPNAPLAYDMGSKLHYPKITILGGHGVHLDIYIYIYIDRELDISIGRCIDRYIYIYI